MEVLSRDLGYPDQSELQGAIKGLARLQKVYNLATSDLADGIIGGLNYGSDLRWRECYEIGVQLFDLGEYQRSLEWLQVAFILLRNSPREEKDADHYLSDIREYASMANFELGNPKKAARLLSQILESQPTHSAQQTQKYLESRVPGKNVQETKPSWFSNYTRLCQGRRLPEERSGDPLRCYLDGKRHAYFKQILSIFEEADKEEMVRSAVAGSGGERTVRDLRVSQQTWLDYKSPVMNSVSRIIQFVSGFDMAGAEHMQVANYGVGGQYEPHPDYFEVNLPKNFEGDRISTSMFYVGHSSLFSSESFTSF